MQGWRKINFIDEFATAFRVPVFIEQDARAGALAHYLFDPSVHADDNLAYYLVGEGVGLGVIDNGRLINGSSVPPPKSDTSPLTSTAAPAIAATSAA